MKISDIPLRERKMAKTKIDLLKVMLAKTADKRLEDISVKEICEAVPVSEATFFNYFSKKTDLLMYFIHLWCLEVIYLVNKKYGNANGLKKIEMIFELAGERKTTGNARIMMELLAFQALAPEPISLDLGSVSVAEKILYFPHYEGIEALDINHFNEIFMMNLELAKKEGDIRPEIDLNDVMIFLSSTFYGMPLAVNDRTTETVTKYYKMIIGNVWNAIVTK